MAIFRFVALATMVALGVLGGGCATVLNGDHQMVAFSTEPEGALVKVDGVPMGRTPCVVPVPRKGGDKLLMFELENYKTVMTELDNHIHAAGFGNIILGGLVGVVVDAASGRAGSYQDSLHIVMEPGTGTINYDAKAVRTASSSTATPAGTSNSQSYTGANRQPAPVAAEPEPVTPMAPTSQTTTAPPSNPAGLSPSGSSWIVSGSGQ